MRKKIVRLILIGMAVLMLSSCGDGETVGPAKLKTVTGKEISFSDLKGKFVAVNFWASWCEPCHKEIPELNAFSKKHADEVIMLAYNYDHLSQDLLIKEGKRAGIEFEMLSEDPSEALGIKEIIGLPVTFVFNEKGKLVETLYRPQTMVSLEKTLQYNRV